jgi:hypothetical protein
MSNDQTASAAMDRTAERIARIKADQIRAKELQAQIDEEFRASTWADAQVPFQVLVTAAGLMVVAILLGAPRVPTLIAFGLATLYVGFGGPLPRPRNPQPRRAQPK